MDYRAVNNNNDIDIDIGPPVLQRGYAVNIPVENEAIIFEEAQGYKVTQVIQENKNQSIDASGARECCHQKK
jgi:hypothetical protein